MFRNLVDSSIPKMWLAFGKNFNFTSPDSCGDDPRRAATTTATAVLGIKPDIDMPVQTAESIIQHPHQYQHRQHVQYSSDTDNNIDACKDRERYWMQYCHWMRPFTRERYYPSPNSEVSSKKSMAMAMSLSMSMPQKQVLRQSQNQHLVDWSDAVVDIPFDHNQQRMSLSPAELHDSTSSSSFSSGHGHQYLSTGPDRRSLSIITIPEPLETGDTCFDDIDRETKENFALSSSSSSFYLPATDLDDAASFSIKTEHDFPGSSSSSTSTSSSSSFCESPDRWPGPCGFDNESFFVGGAVSISSSPGSPASASSLFPPPDANSSGCMVTPIQDGCYNNNYNYTTQLNPTPTPNPPPSICGSTTSLSWPMSESMSTSTCARPGSQWNMHQHHRDSTASDVNWISVPCLPASAGWSDDPSVVNTSFIHPDHLTNDITGLPLIYSDQHHSQSSLLLATTSPHQANMDLNSNNILPKPEQPPRVCSNNNNNNNNFGYPHSPDTQMPGGDQEIYQPTQAASCSFENHNPELKPATAPTQPRRTQPCRDRTNMHNSNNTAKTITKHTDTRNTFLIECKRRGLSYKDIKRLGGFKEAESTLRGRFRTLTKCKEQRVRKPQWQARDIQLLCEAVNMNACSESCKQACASISVPVHVSGSSCSGFMCRLKGSTQPPKVSWKKVGQYIWTHGGSYHFGNATCKKKWCEIHGVKV